MGIWDSIRAHARPPQERRAENNRILKGMGIACFDELPVRESGEQVSVRSLDDICRRTIAGLLSIQLACDIAQQNDYDESRELFYEMMGKYGVTACLLEKEKRLFAGTYTEQDVVDVAWTYETVWSLLWALGRIERLDPPDQLCDCERAIDTVVDCDSFDDFKQGCRLRNKEKILDMLDLFYRYHWACEEKRLRPQTSIGSLNPEVVVERRRGLEWLVGEWDDWNDIPLDT
ncbi:DUF4272 domain-containing protein [Feifania hominis]